MRGLIVFLVLIALLAGGGVFVARYFKPTLTEAPTVKVRRGDFLVKTYTRGELRVVKSAMVIAPNIGGSLSITQMASMGGSVQEKQVVLQFDPAEQVYHLQTHQSELDEAQQTIVKSKADSAIQEQQDRVDLMKAEFGVRRAQLDVSRGELDSDIDRKKNQLALAAAQKKLAQLRDDVQSHKRTSDADLAVAQEKLNKAKLDLKQAQQRIDQITLHAPMSGLVSIRTNQRASGGMFYPGIDLPDYREGDQVFSGDTVMEIVDTAQMEVGGKINEVDRGNLKEGQDVIIRVDALPNEELPGKVKSLAGMTSRGFFGPDPTKTFDAVFSLGKQDPRLRPGLSAEVEVITERLKDAVYVPLQAVFDKEGKKWVFVRRDGGFVRTAVKVGRRSESQVVVVDGLHGNEQIALLDPEDRSKSNQKGKNPLSGGPMGM